MRASFLVLGGCDQAGLDSFRNPTDALSVCNRAQATLSVIDPTTNEVVGTVVVIDTQTEQVWTVIEVGEKPTGINTCWQPGGTVWERGMGETKSGCRSVRE